MKCKYCQLEMNPTGHFSGACNGWTCETCGHIEPEMGSFSLAGRPEDVDLSCHCKNCIQYEKDREVMQRDFEREIYRQCDEEDRKSCI